MLYESFPMAYIIESAGGLAVTPYQNILDIQPKNIHQSCPVFLGSKGEVEKVLKHYNIKND